MDERELGPFLRSRRAAVSPADVGLPVGTRRRTPGLRRAELATLAGISVDYLVRLEQGRDRRPSAQVLAALADALRLDDDDRRFLRNFSVTVSGSQLCPSVPVPAATIRPTVQRMLDQFEPNPAFVLNRLCDVLAWNAGFERVARPVGLLDGMPNVARFTFADPRARAVYPDWSTVADDCVFGLRAETWTSDPYAEDLLRELHATGEEFAGRWDLVTTTRGRTGTHRLAHPEAGELRLTFEVLHPADEGQRLVVYFPADEPTGRALDRLAGRYPGALRAVIERAG